MHKKCPVITAGFGVVFLLLGIVCAWYAFPKLATTALEKEIALRPGSTAWKFWEKLPVVMKIKYYFFNVTNPFEMQNGAMPILKQLGPYVYDLHKEKTRIQPNEVNDTAEFYQRKYYYFNEEESGCRSHNDIVTIVNPMLIGTALKIERLLPAALASMSEALPYMYPGIKDIFLRGAVRNILFDGILLACHAPEIDFICKTLKKMLPVTMRPSNKDWLFSLFHHLNGTEEGPYVIQLGNVPNTSKGEINSWKGVKVQKIWYGDTCNTVNGTDGGVFPPIKPRLKKLYVFSPDFCRSLYIEKEGEFNYKGIRTFRFTNTKTLFGQNKDNECFCPRIKNLDEELVTSCTPHGTLDLNPCVTAPMTVSFPHFYMGDEKLVKGVHGLSPSKKKHEIFMYIDPLTGTPLSGRIRMQMNAHVKNYASLDFELMSNVSEAVVPFMWLEEGVDIPDNLLAKVQEGHFGLQLLTIMKWCIILIGLILLLCSLLMVMKREKLICFSNNGSAKISQLQFSAQRQNRHNRSSIPHSVISNKGDVPRDDFVKDMYGKRDLIFNTSVNYPTGKYNEYSKNIVSERGVNPNLIRRPPFTVGEGSSNWAYQN